MESDKITADATAYADSLPSVGFVPLITLARISRALAPGQTSGPMESLTQKALRMLDEAMTSYPANTSRGLYCLELWLTTEVLVSNIVRVLSQYKRQKAVMEMEDMNVGREFSNTEKLSSLLTAGLRLMLMCGQSFIVVSLATAFLFAIGLPVFEGPLSSDQQTLRTIAGIVALTFFGVCSRTVWIEHRLKKKKEMNKTKAAKLDTELELYLAGQYRLAARQAEDAWKRLRCEGKPCAVIDEKAFVSMVMGMTFSKARVAELPWGNPQNSPDSRLL